MNTFYPIGEYAAGETLNLPIIPENITVHLGLPNQSAQNVTVPFINYIKNVASHEVYPTWPEEAIKANVVAQITFALNRIYTEFYRNQGYNFNITNTTAYDQNYVHGGTIFENISDIVDEVFDSYIHLPGHIEPMHTAYCDGRRTLCAGLRQWDTVDLANQGYGFLDILRYYYGEDIIYEEDVPVQYITDSTPGRLLRYGAIGNDVRLAQVMLNRISTNFPTIPKIYVVDGVFGPNTERAVREFQRVFGLTVDGIVGKSTWRRMLRIFNGVKGLNELTSEALTYEEIQHIYPDIVQFGDRGQIVDILQFYLNFLAGFNPYLKKIPRTGVFDEATEEQLRAFQHYRGLPETGILDNQTRFAIDEVYKATLESLPDSAFIGQTKPYPGYFLRLGFSGEYVLALQIYLQEISRYYPGIPINPVSSYFGPDTEAAVMAFQETFDLPVTGVVDPMTWELVGETYLNLLTNETATV